MKRLALVGSGISYSLSPRIHNLIYQHMGIDARYELFDTDDLQAALPILRRDFHGFNVTKPFKRDIIAHIDTMLTPCSSVNTVLVRDGLLAGTSTDGVGLELDLQRMGWCADDRDILILGTGGMAQAVVDTFGTRARLMVWGKDAEQFALRNGIQVYDGQSPQILISGLTSGVSLDFGFVNTARLQLVYDAGYDPLTTPLMAYFASRGIRTANGTGMLVMQALHSDRLFVDLWPNPQQLCQLVNILFQEISA